MLLLNLMIDYKKSDATYCEFKAIIAGIIIEASAINILNMSESSHAEMAIRAHKPIIRNVKNNPPEKSSIKKKNMCTAIAIITPIMPLSNL